LFALILSLALIVDDTIIMVEAIDAQRKRQRSGRKAVEEATSKVSRAMLSATFTAALSFAPLLFVSGIFVPIPQMPSWARWIAPISPLSYAGDLIRVGFGQSGYFPLWLSPLVLIIFPAALMWGAYKFHRRWRSKGL
jgi:hypothetical protein